MLKSENHGIRPVLTIKGSVKIKQGDGTQENPYSLGDLKIAKGGDALNTRVTGEYIQYSGRKWRIIEAKEGQPTKVVATLPLNDENGLVNYTYSDPDDTEYNPKKYGNVGYRINNRSTQYLDTSLIVNHKISVPVYNKVINYGKEKTNKEYTVKVSAQNGYEIFSAFQEDADEFNMYWFCNTGKDESVGLAMFFDGETINKTYSFEGYGIRPVVYLNKKALITSGSGQIYDPYIIK